MVYSDLTRVTFILVKIHGELVITVIFSVFRRIHTILSHLTSSPVLKHGYEKKDMEIIYTLVFRRTR